LSPIEKILNEGNEASKFLEKFHEGYTIDEIVETWVQESLEEDLKIESRCKAIS
jgi:cell division protein YceG involved in septum cleavage